MRGDASRSIGNRTSAATLQAVQRAGVSSAVAPSFPLSQLLLLESLALQFFCFPEPVVAGGFANRKEQIFFCFRSDVP
jgi:hypothetical protein